ncbi:TetR/AcrR family transcriptional regulator [Actinocorallia sp. API 0066]|uniref:TetR/AcrR family transcriptional regulator n=1 Tax=Actinocorallia sp. API 0066 TaxID=2896846 RepID=UPI001E419A64|nr:TetR/AcrR family transcriptional regulator [Actinocorallia sp. API 0066]MCD0449632.1 TetR/AcrR family transcriptional regulator [Actinocorallia sp. API 0066]
MATARAPREALLETAARLFADLGYDQTTSALIAVSAGVPVKTITEEFGGRRGLYRAVYQRLQEWEFELVETYFREGMTLEELHRFADIHLDLLDEKPHVAALRVQRWMHDAVDTEIEGDFVRPQADRVIAALTPLCREGVDPTLAMWMLSWMAQLHTLGGIPGERPGPRFRRHAHAMIDTLMRQP